MRPWNTVRSRAFNGAGARKVRAPPAKGSVEKESTMKRLGILLAFAVFGAALGTSGPASAAEVSCWYNGGLHSCMWYPGYTYSYEYPYGFGLEALATAPLALATDATAPLVTGRSAAVETAPLITGRSVAVETVPLT